MLLIDHRIRKENFPFQVFQVRVIEVKSSLQGTIRDSSLVFQQVDDLGENLIEGHGMPLRCLAFPALVPPIMTQIWQEGKPNPPRRRVADVCEAGLCLPNWVE